MAAKKSKKKALKRQGRAVRIDAKVGKAEKLIEDYFALPAGSVRLVLPSGRDARSDAKIGTLLKKWV